MLYRIGVSEAAGSVKRVKRRLFALMTGMTLGCAAQAWSAPDMVGHDIVLKGPPTRIADLWFAHNGLLVMLGAADRIVFTVDRPSDEPWMFAIAPQMRQARWTSAQSPNVEAMVRAGVQVVFISHADGVRVQCLQAGLPTADMTFHDDAGLRDAVTRTADILGDARARVIAARYNMALKATLARIAGPVGHVPVAKRVRVLHLQSLAPLRVDGAQTIVDRWITLAGGRNVAASVSGNKVPVTIEQIIAWDPDVIIIPGDAPDPENQPDHVAWNAIRAVQEGLVYRNPRGVFPWDRYGPEFLLQVQWAAKLFNPTPFSGLDLGVETITFYRDFYHTVISRRDAQAILRADLPPEGRDDRGGQEFLRSQ